MQTLSHYQEETVSSVPVTAPTIIFGLGETGFSCARFLAARGMDFAMIDTRDEPSGLSRCVDTFPGVTIETGVRAPDRIGLCREILLSPGVAREHPVVVGALARGVSVIGDVELFSRYAAAPILAVTGSNGKSTVVTMVSRILASAGLDVRTGGNIGTPALDLLADSPPDCYVLELSSFQLESIQTFAPTVACILNVSSDHMDRYGSFADYLAAKLRVADRAETVVVNADDLTLAKAGFAAEVRGVSLDTTLNTPYTVERADGNDWLVAGGERIMTTDELGVRGKHNVLNALAAIAISDSMSVARDAQRTGLARFSGLPHRCESVACDRTIEWINDSKGTNVGATCTAIASVFSGRSGVLIAGGQGKGADFAPLADALAGHVHHVVLFGEDAGLLGAALEHSVSVQFAVDLPAAVTCAHALALEGDAVLFSPACASFDMFDNFSVRGDAFTAAVSGVLGR